MNAWAAGLSITSRVMSRATGRVYTRRFVDTRGRGGAVPDDVCPLGARRVHVAGVPRVAAAYVWGDDDPKVLALHGWGGDSAAMSPVADAALAGGESAVCFDAPGHGVSPGRFATITEYACATVEVLSRFPSVRTVVAHSLASIAAVAALRDPAGHRVEELLLLAPACSLTAVLDRWAAQRRLPRRVVAQIDRELTDRDGVPVSHWDITTLGVAPALRVRILHDPADDRVPVSDAHRIATSVGADVVEVGLGTGHHGILGCAEMRAALAACLHAGPAR